MSWLGGGAMSKTDRGDRSWWRRRSEGERNAVIIGVFGLAAAVIAGLFAIVATARPGNDGGAADHPGTSSISPLTTPETTTLSSQGQHSTPPTKATRVPAGTNKYL